MDTNRKVRKSLFSIVVPCFNEAENIPILVKGFNEEIDNDDINIVLVDNGSVDNSSEVIRDLCETFSFLSSVKVVKNIGYGNGIISGLKECDTDFIGWTHADLQCNPKDVVRSINMIRDMGYPKNIYIKGERKGRPFVDNFFTLGMSIFETIFFQQSLFDINAQPNLFHKDFFRSWNNPPNDFSLDLYSLYLTKIKNIKVKRFNVTFPPRVHGESKWNTGFRSKIKFIKRTISYSFKLKKELNESTS